MFTFLTQSSIEALTEKDSATSGKLMPCQQVQLVPSERSMRNPESATLKEEEVFFNQEELLKPVLQTQKEYVMTCHGLKDSYHSMHYRRHSFTR